MPGRGERFDDRARWERARDGDEDAFAAVYRDYRMRVYSYLFRRSASWSVAEDLTSIVFLEAWAQRARITLSEDMPSLLPWLLTVGSNQLVREQRVMARYRRALARLPRGVIPDGSVEAIDRVDDERRMKAILDHHLKVLTGKELEVLTLVAWEGLSVTEVATALGVPASTVRSRLAAARDRLHREEGRVRGQR